MPRDYKTIIIMASGWDFMPPFPSEYQRMAQKNSGGPIWEANKLKTALVVLLVGEAAFSTLRDPIKCNGSEKLPQYFPPLT